MKYEILDTRIYTSADIDRTQTGLTSLGGCSDLGRYDDKGLSLFQVEFDITVTNHDNESEKFTVVFQPEERSNGIQNYSGFEMATAGKYGLDCDESSKVEEFCDYDDFVITSLQDIAEDYAKAELNSLLAVYKKPVYDLSEYIGLFYSGSQRQFAEAQNVKPAQITQWLNKKFVVINHNLYSHRRELI